MKWVIIAHIKPALCLDKVVVAIFVFRILRHIYVRNVQLCSLFTGNGAFIFITEKESLDNAKIIAACRGKKKLSELEAPEPEIVEEKPVRTRKKVNIDIAVEE